jgi:DNA-binding transcriptional regulator GbsR (MarR family)
MELAAAKEAFINNWGAFSSQWGINRTMAQIHALLLITAKPLTQDDIMAELTISRGNVNMNIRELIDWGLVERVIVQGERKDYFTAEKDIWKVGMTVARERKKRELDPMLKLLTQLEKVNVDKKDPDAKQFVETVKSINKLGANTNKMIETMIKAEENWFSGNLLRFFMGK